MVLHTNENVDDELVRNVLEALIEVADASLRVLLEDLELGVLLVQLVGQRATWMGIMWLPSLPLSRLALAS
jgi:hypothetical protein